MSSKLVWKCAGCGYEWNGRGEQQPKQCANHCGSRDVRLLTLAPVNSGDVNNELVNKPDVNNGDEDRRFVDSVAAPGVYRICRKHGRRYCVECGTANPKPPAYSAQQWTEAYNAIQKAAKAAAKQQPHA